MAAGHEEYGGEFEIRIGPSGDPEVDAVEPPSASPPPGGRR
ncbi:hypothetical protein ACFV30_08740 [Streptomyces sp. NPDC059752]